MTMKKQVEVKISREKGQEIHNEVSQALGHLLSSAKEKDEDGFIYGLHNIMYQANRAWLNHMAGLPNVTVREIMEGHTEFLTDCVYNSFVESDKMQARITREEKDHVDIEDTDDLEERVREAISEIAGVDPIFAIAGNSLQELIDRLQAQADSEGQTRQ